MRLFSRLLILFFVANFSARAEAEPATGDTDSIPTWGYADEVSKIPIYRKEECLKTLRPIVAPEALIKAGLTALADGPAPAAERLSCLDQFLPNWNTLMRDPALVSAAPGESYALDKDPEYIALRDKYKALDHEVSCLNPHEPESPHYALWFKNDDHGCNGKFTNPALKEEKREQQKAAWLAMNDFVTAKNFDNNIEDLSTVFFPMPAPSEAYRELQKKARCLIPGPELPAHCEGKVLSNEERAALGAAIVKLDQEESAERAKIANYRQAMFKLLTQPETVAKHFDVPKLKENYRRLRCLGGAEGQVYPVDGAAKRYCDKMSYPTTGDRGPLFTAVRNSIADPAGLVDQWNIEEKKRNEARAARARLVRQDNEVNYGLRRLLALYRWHTKHYPGQSEALEKFCATNEQTQLNDLEFSRRAKKIRPLDTEAAWAWAGAHGLSEGAITALKEYTGSHYRVINDKLWRAKPGLSFEPLSPENQLFRNTLNEALDRAIPYRNKPVRRFSALPPAVLAAHQEGKIVTYDAFTSTSKRDNWRWNPGLEEVQSFVIYSARGVDVSDVSSNPGEGEVLFKSGTRFKVLSRKQRVPGLEGYDFVLAEVDEDGKLLVSPPPAGSGAPVAP